MTKEIEFENGLDELITETFESLAKLKHAIKHFGDQPLADFLEAHLATYEEMERADK